MPELPEVEIVARGLRLSVLGRRILSVTLRKTDFIDDPSLIERHLPGRRIEAVERYGKFMLLRLSAAQGEENSANTDNAPAALLVHLGMTGHIASTAVTQPWEKHTHASFALDDGRELRYTDTRRFGRLAYLSEALLPAELEGFGADPLEVTAEEFATRIRSRRSRIKALLLDQTVLRGVGNIYADESLWRAKIHPAKLGASINKKQAAVLHRSLQDILKKAIVMRGSSIANFVDGDGQPGEYQQHHRAYGRDGEKCFRCGSIIRRAIVAGRSSYFCTKCQIGPRGFLAISLTPRKSRRKSATPDRKKNAKSLGNRPKHAVSSKRRSQ
ncbi:MAG TPA: bifunctional DNA-formamidopyrimidine glycosylase/DNA-(apurinic or apyrimidinic site) lyase [Candidatus Acidoferrum sp.]|jgi:formamidopyrimidine-DNA glycosylase|nr:bifunctional DNA-formamidopyrimidine glycosylase/DNA-(apurinic or apyrimidinic site) lyase [Candidatus Acidoferrum sp.]